MTGLVLFIWVLTIQKLYHLFFFSLLMVTYMRSLIPGSLGNFKLNMDLFACKLLVTKKKNSYVSFPLLLFLFFLIRVSCIPPLWTITWTVYYLSFLIKMQFCHRTFLMHLLSFVHCNTNIWLTYSEVWPPIPYLE